MSVVENIKHKYFWLLKEACKKFTPEKFIAYSRKLLKFDNKQILEEYNLVSREGLK